MGFCGDDEMCGLLSAKTSGQEISKVLQDNPFKKKSSWDSLIQFKSQIMRY